MKKLSFSQKVLKIVSKIPRGKIMTYKEVAILCGRPKACRAVGNILNKNFKKSHNLFFDSKAATGGASVEKSISSRLATARSNNNIPCHRVIKSNGEIGDYALGKKKKEDSLKKEGIKIKKHFVVLKSPT